MSTDEDLFPPYANTDTSFAAAESVAEDASAKRARVFAIIAAGPTTCDAIEAVTGWPHQTVSARVWELHDKQKRIVDGGQRRLTRNKRWAIVWRVVDDEHPWVPIKRAARPPIEKLRWGATAMRRIATTFGREYVGEGFIAIMEWVESIIEIDDGRKQ
jgi:hypothetical protein